MPRGKLFFGSFKRIWPINLAVWSTTKPPEGGTLTGREQDNAADHAERSPARVPRLRGKVRFMGSGDIQQVDAHWDHEPCGVVHNEAA